MVNALEVDPNRLIEAVAKKFQNEKTVTPPEWAFYVKTGVHADRPPVSQDWWYYRCAAVLRSVYKLGPIGTSKLRLKYGGRQNRGMRPERFRRGGGSIIRKALQQLEAAGLIQKSSSNKRKGREVTAKGKSLLDKEAVRKAK